MKSAPPSACKKVIKCQSSSLPYPRRPRSSQFAQPCYSGLGVTLSPFISYLPHDAGTVVGGGQFCGLSCSGIGIFVSVGSGNFIQRFAFQGTVGQLFSPVSSSGRADFAELFAGDGFQIFPCLLVTGGCIKCISPVYGMYATSTYLTTTACLIPCFHG